MNLARSPAPRQSLDASDPLAELARRATRLALVVEATSRRRDVRELRSRLLLLLLALRCPLAARPARRWYMPGAVARVSVEALRRAWATSWRSIPPSERRLRGHLKTLERALGLVRIPGDWVEGRWRGPRPRYPDTLLLLTTEAEADWWGREGLGLLDAHPQARTNPTRWRELFGRWRSLARTACLPFPPPDETPPASAPPAPEQAAAELVRAAGGAAEPLALLAALRSAGARLHGPTTWRLAGDPNRLRGAVGCLARALWRGDRIRSRAAWLVAILKRAERSELEAGAAWARAWCSELLSPGGSAGGSTAPCPGRSPRWQ